MHNGNNCKTSLGAEQFELNLFFSFFKVLLHSPYQLWKTRRAAAAACAVGVLRCTHACNHVVVHACMYSCMSACMYCLRLQES